MVIKRKVLAYFGFYFDEQDDCWHNIIGNIVISMGCVEDSTVEKLINIITSLKRRVGII